MDQTYEFKEVHAKTILTKCGIPGIDYVVNPYTGCRFGCTYCYASFMGSFCKIILYQIGETMCMQRLMPQSF